MRAARYDGPGSLAVVDVPRPVAGPGEVVAEVDHCGVCGTDLHVVLDGWGSPGTIGGHEWSGRVVEVGPGVAGWSPGDPVVGVPSPACGTCALCAAGRPSLCERRPAPGTGGRAGAFAELVCAPAAQLVAVPHGLSLRHAALAEPLAVALHALTLSGVGSHERVLVSGFGPIGAAIAAVLVHRGARDFGVVEPGELRRRLATSLGAVARSPDELDPPSMPYDVAADAYDVVFECSGARPAGEVGLAVLARRGRLVLVGTGLDKPRFDTNRILLNELIVTGAFNYDAGGFEAALALLGEPGFPVETLLEPDAVGLDELAGAMVRLRSGELAGKVLVRPRGG